MAVDPNEVSEMTRLIRMMNEGVNFDEPAEEARTSLIEGKFPVESSEHPDPAVASMKRILEAFHGIDSPDKALTQRSTVDRELREAMDTEITDRGTTRVGSWEIVINENDQGLKSYDVTSTFTGDPIASNLTVYDAALGITRHLNEGRKINSPEILNILNTESAYDSNRQDAANFKARMNENHRAGNTQRAMIMEDRYVQSLEKAKSARVQLSKLCK